MDQLPSSSSTDSSGSQIARARQLEVLHNFASRQAQLTHLDDIVWNIAKTAIAELGFEDCVVYLLDDDGVTLRQVAAHGPKNPVEREIFNRITITVGEGIVGYVAATGEVQLIDDARRDARYIEDDDFRLSELAVPITHQGRVIGVLDSEHHEAEFFTQEDVQLFTTIAALASTRIDAALALAKLHKTVRDLEAAREQLEGQAKELTQARAAAEAASAAKSNFLANMSHEIRTPMTAIVGFAELLAEGDADQQQQVLWRNQLTRNARYLQDLIGNVLDVSAVEAGVTDISLYDIPLYEFISDTVEIFRPKTDAKGLQLTLSSRGQLPTGIISDRLKLREILVNLLSNAVKYTEKGDVKVYVSSRPTTQGAQVRISVADSGIGIATEAIESLFTPFSRVHDTKRLAGIEGTGLGLSLAQKFAGLIGGDITVSSELGEGSVFTLEFITELSDNAQWMMPAVNPFAALALKPQLTKTQGPEEIIERHFADHSILVCEDSEPIAALVKVLLEREGAAVSVCSNGLEGVQRFEILCQAGIPPDLIIMDMQMPLMDGYEATRIIKDHSLAPAVIALTAFALKEDADRCLAAGCDFYLNKPINTKTFTRELKRLHGEFELRRALG